MDEPGGGCTAEADATDGRVKGRRVQSDSTKGGPSIGQIGSNNELNVGQGRGLAIPD